MAVPLCQMGFPAFPSVLLSSFPLFIFFDNAEARYVRTVCIRKSEFNT